MRALRWTSGAALVLTFAVIVLGAWVRSTGSGLSCPDWPTCYGHWVPLPGDIPADAGYSYFQVMLEWVHRLLAGVVLGPLLLALGVLSWRARRQDPALPLHGGVVLFLLLIQAGLGGVTVLDQNSPWSVALHLGTALLLFSALWLVFERSGGTRARIEGTVRPLSVLVWLLAFATLVSAAMVAKTGSSLACSTWPLCDGALIPDLSDPSVRLNFTHRLLAAGLGFGVLVLYLAAREHPSLRRLAGLALVMVLIAIGAGALVVLLEVPVWKAVLHQATGVLTFGIISLLMWRVLSPAPAAHRQAAHVRLSDA